MQKMCGKFRKIVGKFWNKFPEIPKYSKKILKISEKFPQLSKGQKMQKIQQEIRKILKILTIPDYLPRAYLTSVNILEQT